MLLDFQFRTSGYMYIVWKYKKMFAVQERTVAAMQWNINEGVPVGDL